MTPSADPMRADSKPPLSQRRAKLIQKIKIFMKLLNENSDTSFSRLLIAVIAHLKKQSEIDRSDSSELQKNLQIIQCSLNRIEKRDVTDQSYVDAVKKSAESQRSIVSTSWKTETILKKKRLIKKLIIKIIDIENVARVKKMQFKNIMKIIQTQTAKITRVRRLSSDDIRVHTLSKKTKNELQNNSE